MSLLSDVLNAVKKAADPAPAPTGEIRYGIPEKPNPVSLMPVAPVPVSGGVNRIPEQPRKAITLPAAPVEPAPVHFNPGSAERIHPRAHPTRLQFGRLLRVGDTNIVSKRFGSYFNPFYHGGN